jgi:hypothetical protein
MESQVIMCAPERDHLYFGKEGQAEALGPSHSRIGRRGSPWTDL